MCGKEITDVIPKIPDDHTHSYSTEWQKNETHHWKVCSCGAEDEKAAHTWNEETTEATCTTDGTKTSTCTTCNMTKTETIPAKGHTFSTEWKYDDTHHWHEATCEHTTEKSAYGEHNPSGYDWQVITPATLHSEGQKKTICTYCLKELFATIPKLETLESSEELLANKNINGVEYSKTTEVDIANVEVTVVNEDDSSWNTYYSGTNNIYKSEFRKDRNITLSPFAMGQYEITQELYKAVLQNDAECNSEPNNFTSEAATGEEQAKRPVDNVSWYDAVYFCNALTKLTMTEADCVYTITNITRDETSKSITSATVTQDITKKGYRLPTDAEWEYSARGGKDSETWKYSYAGVNTSNSDPTKFASADNKIDDGLNNYAWYSNNSDNKTHEVGTKTPNSLNLYDMCGNVAEWCWDIRSTSGLGIGNVTNPTGPASGTTRYSRGGSYDSVAYLCCVSYLYYKEPKTQEKNMGFRIARTL